MRSTYCRYLWLFPQSTVEDDYISFPAVWCAVDQKTSALRVGASFTTSGELDKSQYIPCIGIHLPSSSWCRYCYYLTPCDTSALLAVFCSAKQMVGTAYCRRPCPLFISFVLLLLAHITHHSYVISWPLSQNHTNTQLYNLVKTICMHISAFMHPHAV